MIDTQNQAHAPRALVAAATRWGPHLGTEAARGQWTALVAAAEAGRRRLLSRRGCAGWSWALLVPAAEAGPRWSAAEHTVSAARGTLGRLVAEAHAGVPQLISRRGRVAAALIPCDSTPPRPGGRIDVDALLRDGGTVLMAIAEDNPDAVTARAFGPDAGYLGSGTGPDPVSALSGITFRGTGG